MKRRTNAPSDGPKQVSRRWLRRAFRRGRARDRRERPIDWLAGDPVFRRLTTTGV